VWRGHQKAVNAIKWDPPGSILASCGDDELLYLWSPKQSEPLKALKDHTMSVNMVKWSNVPNHTQLYSSVPLLGSAGFDKQVKLWDVELGKVIMSLHGHK
jgi:transducin (beta)-like 1